MGLIVSRLITGKGKIEKCNNQIKLSFKNPCSIRLIEDNIEGTTELGNTKIDANNIVEYVQNKKCILNGIITIIDQEYEVIINTADYKNGCLSFCIENPELKTGCYSMTFRIVSCISTVNLNKSTNLENIVKNIKLVKN